MKDNFGLIQACQKGEKWAIEQLYHKYSPVLFGISLRYARDYTEAEDILQEGFIKIFLKIKQYQGKGSFEGWLKKVVINTALEKIRKKNPVFPSSEVVQISDDLDYEHLLDHINAEELLSLVRELSPQYRAVFNLYAIEGYTHKEIGEILGISEGTSKSNLARARMILQKKVKKRFYVPDANKIG